MEHPLSEAFSPFLQRVMANPASGPGWRSQACVSAAWFRVRSWSELQGRENFKRAVGARELQVGAGRGGGLAKPESPRNHMQVSNTCPELCCSLHMPRWNDTNLYTDVRFFILYTGIWYRCIACIKVDQALLRVERKKAGLPRWD